MKYKEIIESATDVERYQALMKQTDGEWNVWDDKQKRDYIKKWSWDSTQMKLIKRKKEEKEKSAISKPIKTPQEDTEVKNDTAEADAAAEEQYKNEVKAKKQKAKKLQNIANEFEKESKRFGNLASDMNNKGDSEISVKVLAAIQTVNRNNEEQ